jgi:hypothetical protein
MKNNTIAGKTKGIDCGTFSANNHFLKQQNPSVREGSVQTRMDKASDHQPYYHPPPNAL